MSKKTKIQIWIALAGMGICFFVVNQERKKLKEIIQDCPVCSKEFEDYRNN